MRDHIPDTLIAAFERQYDSSWNDPKLRKERLAMRYGWAAAMEAKQCLHQIQEPTGNHSEIPSSSVMPNNCSVAAPAAVAVPDEREALQDGEWYWIEKEGWHGNPPTIAPALYKAECDAWYSFAFAGIPTRQLKVLEPCLLQARAALAATPEAAPVVLPEPVGAIAWNRDGERPTFHAGCTNKELLRLKLNEGLTGGPYRTEFAFTEPQLRALLATGGQAQAVRRGEVLVTVSGFTGSGKSAIAGEIEILCRALGLQVEWPDGESEKNMTHADWTAALEQYKPRVRIVEQNIPFVSKKGLSK